MEAFLCGDMFEIIGHRMERNALEIKALAAREDGNGDFVWFGGGKGEEDVFGGFFECFEECVEGFAGKHVNFVDDEDFAFPFGGGILHIVA